MPDTHATAGPRCRAELAGEIREWMREQARDNSTLDESALTVAERADVALSDLYAVAERIAIAADRRGRAGDNPETIALWADWLRSVERAMVARLAR
jgi:hypothetical protein